MPTISTRLNRYVTAPSGGLRHDNPTFAVLLCIDVVMTLDALEYTLDIARYILAQVTRS